LSGNAKVPTNQKFTFEDNISVRSDRRYRAVFNAAKDKNKSSVPGNEEDTFDIFESLTSFFKDQIQDDLDATCMYPRKKSSENNRHEIFLT
jgi:hypothetical protein